MITRADDYPIHQTAEPIAVAGGGHRNFYDRYFFNGYARDGSVFFAAALGCYPNRGVVDAAFSVVHDGRQHVLRASRRAGAERLDTHVGPIRVEVLEPLRVLRVVVAGRDELRADLRFTARAGVIEEPRFHRAHAGRVFMDSTRLTQHVEVTGEIAIGGTTLTLAPGQYWGSRDRSWGIRPIGEREPDAPAPSQFFWLWAPVNFPDLCTHFDVNEDADGTRWHAAGMIAPAGGAPEAAEGVDWQIDYQPGTRHARQATVILQPAGAAEPLRIALRPLFNFYMVGLGYQHPVWGHGMVVGDDVAEYESFALADVDPSVPLYLHVQALCEATCGTRRGIGVLEQLAIGPHAPSGFRELLDMA